MDIDVAPEGSLEVLSQLEVNALRSKGEGGLYPLLRRCALAVLTTGSMTDDPTELLAQHADFDVSILQVDRGVRLGLTNAPDSAFVDGQMILGTRELLFSVLRDIVFFHSEFSGTGRFDLTQPDHLTNVVFHILRHAGVESARAAGVAPVLIGLDQLYILIQSVSVAVFGALTFVRVDERIRFAIAVAIMVTFVIALNAVFLRRATADIPLLILGGIVLGGMFASLTALVARLIDPNEFLILEDLLFASFTLINEELLVVSSVAVVVLLLIVARMRRVLDVIALGRPTAIGLGVDYARESRRLIVLIAVLVAVPTALVGPVTFLGLLASNAAYELTKSFRHHITVPVAALSAATLLAAAQFLLEELFDFATRPSIIVGFLGGVVFIVLVLRQVE